MLKVLNEQGKGICFPTSLEEINSSVFESMLSNICIPKYKVIVGMCMESKLFELVSSMRYSKENTVNVETFIAKIRPEDASTLNASVGDKLVIDRSSIERGIHLHIKQPLSQKFVARYFEVNQDVTDKIMRGNYDKIQKDSGLTASDGLPHIYLLEFKIVNLNDISAIVKKREESLSTSFYIE